MYNPVQSFSMTDGLNLTTRTDFSLTASGDLRSLQNAAGGFYVWCRRGPNLTDGWYLAQRVPVLLPSGANQPINFLLQPGVYRISLALGYKPPKGSGAITADVSFPKTVEQIPYYEVQPPTMPDILSTLPEALVYTNIGALPSHIQNFQNTPRFYTEFYRPLGVILGVSFCALYTDSAEFDAQLDAVKTLLRQCSTLGIKAMPYCAVFGGSTSEVYDYWFRTDVWDQIGRNFRRALTVLGTTLASKFAIDGEPYWNDTQQYPTDKLELLRIFNVMKPFSDVIRDYDLTTYQMPGCFGMHNYDYPIGKASCIVSSKTISCDEYMYGLPWGSEPASWDYIDAELGAGQSLGRTIYPGFYDKVLRSPNLFCEQGLQARALNRMFVFPQVEVQETWDNFVHFFFTRQWFDYIDKPIGPTGASGPTGSTGTPGTGASGGAPTS